MEQRPLVSIIIPVYDTEQYLPKCIESVCGQSYTNLQIILVDDQSPDACPDICDQYSMKDSRIVVIHQENKGVSGARNTGISKASGNYLMFVDSDDELYPRAVEILLKDAEAYGADIIWAPQKWICKSRMSKNDDIENEYAFFCDDDSLILALNGAYNTNAVWGKLFKKVFIENLRFEEGKNINEDGFFMFACYMRKPKLVRHNVSVYRYNSREGSCSRQCFSDKYFSMLYFCERKIELVTEYCPQYIEQAYNMVVRTHLQFLDVLCRTNDKKYKDVYKESVGIVREFYKYHRPINKHHKKLAWIVEHGLYIPYKWAVRIKYCRKY